jgi:biopolymer transport protein TolQ
MSQLAQQSADNISDIAVRNLGNSTAAVGDSSIFDFFWNSGLLIKIVILSLLFASIRSWTIIIAKHFKLKRLAADAAAFEDSFWSGVPLESLYSEIKASAFDPMSNVFCAAMSEWKRLVARGKTKDQATSRSLGQRIDRIMQIAIRKETDELERNMAFLSSLGTNGVIIGLFGTVIGILGGFKAIALQQNNSIATVAPVISEALVTTALGIVSAIPAAIGYNTLMNNMNRYINRLETFADEFSSIILRQFDE